MRRLVLALVAALAVAALAAPAPASAFEPYDCAWNVRDCAESLAHYAVSETFETYDEFRAINCVTPVVSCADAYVAFVAGRVREASYLLQCFCDPPQYNEFCRQFTGTSCVEPT